jgi:hypothetical protein
VLLDLGSWVIIWSLKRKKKKRKPKVVEILKLFPIHTLLSRKWGLLRLDYWRLANNIFSAKKIIHSKEPCINQSIIVPFNWYLIRPELAHYSRVPTTTLAFKSWNDACELLHQHSGRWIMGIEKKFAFVDTYLYTAKCDGP